MSLCHRSTASRRIATTAALCCVLAVSGLKTARADEVYPSRPINVIVPISAGAQADLLARVLAEQMGQALRQAFVISNRDGAAGTIGVETVKQSVPDGYTLGFGSQGPFTVQPNLRKSLRYSADDFEFICQSNAIILIVAVGPSSPYRSLQELLDAARKAPGTVTLGSVGIGSGPHIFGESIGLEAGVKFNHIPFRSNGDLNTQLIAGNVDFTVTTPALLNVRKDIRALAVTGSTRLANHPDIPLLAELGYKRSSIPGFIGLYAPRRVPAVALDRLREACPIAVKSAQFKAASDSTSSPVQYADSDEYRRNVMQDMRFMADLIPQLGLKPE
ncbi:tripartite tricarboxylate transporter substrate binding protein [soil metagenome]